MSNGPKSNTLKVPGATLYYELRGCGPLLILIAGGPSDASIFRPLAEALENQWTVVSYDPRGNSRSVFDSEPVEQVVDVHGDDAAALITALGRGPAPIFGNSGGAQIGLNLLARYPQLVRHLIAHEPPCLTLLDDAEAALALLDEVPETYRVSGAGAAMALFQRIAGLTPLNGAPTPASARPESKRSPYLAANLNYFLAHGVRPIGRYRPPVEALRTRPPVIALGQETQGQLAHRTGAALAKALGTAPVLFPGDHTGWLHDPRAFAHRLNEQFSGDPCF